MTFTAVVVRVLIASPSDVPEERDRVEATIHEWNATHAAHQRTVLLPVRWELNASAEMGASAQEVINRQMVDDCDAVLGLFWTRLGTPTIASVSGTAEELERLLAVGKPVSLFQSTRPVLPDSIDVDQLQALKSFIGLQRTNGLVQNFETVDELGRLVSRMLTRVVHERFNPNTTPSIPTQQSVAKADVRANVQGPSNGNYRLALVNHGNGTARKITVETRGLEGGIGWDLMGGDTTIPTMQSGGDFGFLFVVTTDEPMQVNCIVRWTNEDGSLGESEQTLGVM